MIKGADPLGPSVDVVDRRVDGSPPADGDTPGDDREADEPGGPGVSTEGTADGSGLSPTSIADLAALMAAVLAEEGCGPGAVAGLHLVDASEMGELNEFHMGGSGPTDVLAFPLDGPGDGECWLVGDVIVCPGVAADQAAGHTGTPLDEMRLLVVHGALHLCGWDHATDEERERMWARERELMTQLDVVPPIDPWRAL